MASVSEKLKSMGVTVGARGLPPPKKRKGLPIEKVVDGQFFETPYGLTFVAESFFPLDHTHGRTNLEPFPSLRPFADWSYDPRLTDSPPRNLIFLDTETTGLSNGPGTYAFLIGAGRFEESGFRIAQFFMRDPDEELAHLAAFLSFLGDYEGLVTFNGKSFDVPLLNTRFISNGEISPLNTAAHIDLLPLARRLWRDRLPSRKLIFLEGQILGAIRSEEDVPSEIVPDLYFKYLLTHDARPLKSIFYHNNMDILAMAALLKHVSLILEDPINGPIDDGVDHVALGKFFEDLGHLDIAAQCFAKGLDCELPDSARSEALQRWSLMEKRRQNLDSAIEIWQQVAARGEIYAFVELAKFYEHRQINIASAIHWTEMGIKQIASPDFPLSQRLQWKSDLEHRRDRLQRKLQR